MSSRSPRSSQKSTTHSPKSSHSPRSHSPKSSHSPRSHSPRSHSPKSSHSPRSHSPGSRSLRSHSPSSHSLTSHSPNSHSSRTTHSPLRTNTVHTFSSSPSSQRPRSSSCVAKKASYTETTTTTTTTEVKSPHRQRRHQDDDVHRSPRRSRDTDDTVVTEIRGHLKPTSPVSKTAEVTVTTKESWDVEGLQRLEEKIAKEKSALIDAQRLVADQKSLYKDALRTADQRLSDAERYDRLVAERSVERDRLLEEEKELERRRAAIHAKAVEVENIRANTLAQAVLAKEEARVSQSLASQRQEGIRQARALEEAHYLAIQRLEEHRIELKRKDVNVHVKGGAVPQPKQVDINVAVLPRDLPEYKMESSAITKNAELNSHVQEFLPHHSKTVVSPRTVRAAEAHQRSTTVERHVVSEKDRVVL